MRCSSTGSGTDTSAGSRSTLGSVSRFSPLIGRSNVMEFRPIEVEVGTHPIGGAPQTSFQRYLRLPPQLIRGTAGIRLQHQHFAGGRTNSPRVFNRAGLHVQDTAGSIENLLHAVTRPRP